MRASDRFFVSALAATLGMTLAACAGAAAAEPAQAPSLPTFEKQTLTERFMAEGCALADFNRDGHVDLTAGNAIWCGPDFTRRIEFTPPLNNPAGMTKTPYDPDRGYSDYFLAFAHDFTGDSRRRRPKTTRNTSATPTARAPATSTATSATARGPRPSSRSGSMTTVGWARK